MKTYTAILASVLLAGGSTSALAVEGMNDYENQDAAADFSVIDRDGDGYINQEDAERAGISQREFEQMNEAGDGYVSEEEFRNHQDGVQDDAWGEPGSEAQDRQRGVPQENVPEGEVPEAQPQGQPETGPVVPGTEREGLPGTEPGIPGTEPETAPGVPGTEPEGQPGTEPGVPGQQPGQQPGVPPQSPQQPEAVPGEPQP